MVKWISSDHCTGCSACSNICPVDALTLQEGKDGFRYPDIDENKCIHCDQCERICKKRIRENENYLEPQTYAAWSKKTDIRYCSTSGGAFSELATAVLNVGGVVIGAQYNTENLVEHTVISNLDELVKIRQSKYVQSDIGLIYREIRKNLAKGRNVLFCGAPCQVAGLYVYLGENAENLLTVDFICRGVNSPKAYKAWLKELETQYNCKASRVWFKYKQNGWKNSPRCTRIDFEDGKHIILDQDENLFMKGYLDYNLYIRPSCGNCQFKSLPRQADITLADFWGVDPEIDDDKGISMILVNNEKGKEVLELVQNLVLHERKVGEIFNGNTYFNKSVEISNKSELFLNSLDEKEFSEALKEYTKIPFGKVIKKKIKMAFRKVLKTISNRLNR